MIQSLVLAGVLTLTAAGPTVTVQKQEAISTLVSDIQLADYAGDRDALRQLAEDLAPHVRKGILGSRVRYWHGFALWRRALNGLYENADPASLEADLETAAQEFTDAAAGDTSFVDAKIAAGSCLLTLATLHEDDAERSRAWLARAVPLLREAEEAEPENPRLMWVLGSSRWHQPPEHGGGQDKAIRMYQTGLVSAWQQEKDESDPLAPMWGEPELLMNLAWSSLHHDEPDLAAAEQYAQSALALVPNWHYVKQILLPQIEAARSKP